MKRILLLISLLCPWLLRATMGIPDVPLTVRKIDLATGKTKWNVALPRHENAYRCEVYPGRMVIYLSKRDSSVAGKGRDPKSHVLFLDSETGRNVEPFDTRNFLHDYEDPLIARAGSPGPIRDSRNELHLSNRWTSLEVGGLSWWNTGTNRVYFTQGRAQPKWAITLPEGAYNLSNWRDILVFRKRVFTDNQHHDTIYAQRAGEDSPAWQFKLPDDVPDVKARVSDVIIHPTPTARSLQHCIGEKEIFVFGNGVLFSLEPDTGKIRWRCTVSDDPALKSRSLRFDYAEVFELGGDLLLSSGRVLAKLNKASRTVTALIREDLSYDPLVISCDGFVYCLTSPRND